MYNSFLSFIIALMLTRNSADARNCYCLASYTSPPHPPPPESQNEPHPFHVKSDWEPPVQPSVALETFLQEVKLELASIEFSDKPKDNISTGERQALKNLLQWTLQAYTQTYHNERVSPLYAMHSKNFTKETLQCPYQVFKRNA